jgi:hypothetical protein
MVQHAVICHFPLSLVDLPSPPSGGDFMMGKSCVIEKIAALAVLIVHLCDVHPVCLHALHVKTTTCT